MTFTLDTSGVVFAPASDIEAWPGYGLHGEGSGKHRRGTSWSDLSPFVQGYVEAMFADQTEVWFDRPSLSSGTGVIRYVGFSDLAPETLALILLDCEAWLRERDDWYGAVRHNWRTAEKGEDFWGSRNGGAWTNFPPLTPYLGDDGKVYLQEGA
jgi:hypothetical protein